MDKLKVAVIWHQVEDEHKIEVLIDDRTAYRGEGGREDTGIDAFLRQLEELDYITLCSYDTLAEYLEDVKSHDRSA